MTEQRQNITVTEHYRLLQLLKKFEDLFDGTLGMWKTTPMDLEVKDNAKPVWLKPYAVPKLHGKTSKSKSKYS